MESDRFTIGTQKEGSAKNSQWWFEREIDALRDKVVVLEKRVKDLERR